MLRETADYSIGASTVTPMAKLAFHSAGGSFVQEVSGIDLWRPLDAETAAALRTAWQRSGVLLFRRQALSEAELVAFSDAFGRPEVIVRTDWQSQNQPEVIQISNMRNQDGQAIGGLGAGELDWHSDQSYVTNPATGAVLYMVEMPKDGGRTYWANLQLAYAALPEAMKTKIEGRRGIFDYLKRQSTYDNEKPMSAELRRKTPPVLHPLVNVHPVTGARSLYLDPSTTVGIEGMPDAEGRALLDELTAHATRDEFVYSHEWQIGDVLLWDNAITLHRRDPFEKRFNRLLKRTTMRLSAERHIIPASELVAA